MKVTLVNKVTEALSTESFFWQAEAKINFLPGQYFYYTLPKLNYPDDRGDTRHFTISSSPTEEGLRLTTRIREKSGYKKTLHELPVGSVIEGKGPEGTFIFNASEPGPHVFIAGGIGITPFRSFTKYAVDKNLNVPLHLIYSNSGTDVVFKKEFDEWSGGNKIKVEYFDSQASGHLNGEVITKYLAAWGLESSKVTFWTAGPTVFVSAVEDILGRLKISEDKIRSDKFNGY